MNNRNACRYWADRLSEALKAAAAFETKLREMGARDPTDAECDADPAGGGRRDR
jgi:hypothetical protein